VVFACCSSASKRSFRSVLNFVNGVGFGGDVILSEMIENWLKINIKR